MVTGAERPDEPKTGLVRYSNVALEVSSGTLLTLQGADDQAVEDMKLRCRSLEVRCPVEDCEAPELSATVSYVRKDGTPVTAYFSHKSGAGDGGHGPEGYARVHVKRALAAWAVGLGFDAHVDVWVPEAGLASDVAIDGPVNFAVDVQPSTAAGTKPSDWVDRNQAFSAAGMEPRSLWMATGGSCVGSLDLRKVAGDYDDLHDIWFAGLDGDGQVKLAMASGFPTFAHEADEARALPIRCQPLWRDLADITLDARGFVDSALLDLIEVNTNPDRWVPADARIPLEPPDPPDGQLFATGERNATTNNTLNISDRSSWSPEELSTPGTRWMRDLLHGRRHEAFLAGIAPELID